MTKQEVVIIKGQSIKGLEPAIGYAGGFAGFRIVTTANSYLPLRVTAEEVKRVMLAHMRKKKAHQAVKAVKYFCVGRKPDPKKEIAIIPVEKIGRG